jgi:hypothetical protein
MFDQQWEKQLKDKIRKAKTVSELPWKKAAQEVYQDKKVIALVNRLAKC